MSCTGAQTRSHNTAALFEQMDKDSPLARKSARQILTKPKGISINRGTASPPQQGRAPPALSVLPELASATGQLIIAMPNNSWCISAPSGPQPIVRSAASHSM